MDPWLEHQLHLAEARGSLKAPNSRVQDRALEYLLMMQERRRQMDRFDGLKIAVLQAPAPSSRAHALFPEYFPAEVRAFDEARRADGTYDIDKIDDAGIDWQVPDGQGVDDDLSAWINSREQGSVSMSDLNDGWR